MFKTTGTTTDESAHAQKEQKNKTKTEVDHLLSENDFWAPETECSGQKRGIYSTGQSKTPADFLGCSPPRSFPTAFMNNYLFLQSLSLTFCAANPFLWRVKK